MENVTVDSLITHLNLKPHPEGGFYVETYRSDTMVDVETKKRSACTAIFFLLPSGTSSHFHRLTCDELWHFYLGGPLTIVELDNDTKEPRTIILGQNVLEGHKLQKIIPRNTWFAAFPKENSKFSLVGCTVAPGFEFIDFEIAKRDELLGQFPQSSHVIEKLAFL